MTGDSRRRGHRSRSHQLGGRLGDGKEGVMIDLIKIHAGDSRLSGQPAVSRESWLYHHRTGPF